MKIFAHSLVCNEERWLWFSVTSVVDYVDKVLLWDTGSTDNSLKIEKELKKRWPDKIDLRQYGKVDAFSFTKARQEMLEISDCDWVMILDGDEVWWEDRLKRARQIIEKEGKKLDSMVHRYYNLVGDIYHYQEEEAGRYRIDGQVGHLNIRFFNRKIDGLHFDKEHGVQGIFDASGVLIQERDRKKRFHTGDYYLHFTHLVRSSTRQDDLKVVKRALKYKYELGRRFPSDFVYPEVFYKSYPSFIENPWQKRSLGYVARALIETPLRKIKRKLWWGKVGY